METFKKEQDKKMISEYKQKYSPRGNFNWLLGRPASKTNFAYVFLDIDRSDVENTNPVPPTTRDEQTCWYREVILHMKSFPPSQILTA